MSSKTPKAEKVQVSEGEKIQTQLAQDQYDHYLNTYAPLEADYREEATRDYSSRLDAQASAAATRESTDTLRQAALSTAPVDTNGLANAATTAGLSGYRQGKANVINGGLSALKQGLGVTADAGQSLTSATQDQTRVALQEAEAANTKARTKLSTGNAALAALGTVGGAYGTVQYMQYKQGQKAATLSSKLGASQEGYDPKYLSGWSLKK